jgi:c-di-GMP phosphodiesterase Gmr
MKMLSNEDFAHGSPILSHQIKADFVSVRHVESQFGWLNTLPIAAAIFQHDTHTTKLIAKNNLFDFLALSADREPGFDLAGLSERINTMIANNRDSHFECWHSPDPINRRELEVTIAHFGDTRQMYMVSLVDRTAEVISRNNLRREMLCDSLTGFFNRTGFEEEVEISIVNLQQKYAEMEIQGNFGIILIDLSRFSRVNESVSTMAGDELIITVARRLKGQVRSHEALCRLGGNEFALFVDLGTEPNSIYIIADRLKSAFIEPCKLSNLEIHVEFAIAAALGAVGNDDPMDVLRFAQIAMKRAKATKRFEMYSPASLDTVKQRFSIETDLRKALQRGELQLHYQPLMDLSTGVINGFEALARWEHPERGFISPVDFIPVAEESGLIVPLGRWALDEAAQTISAWDKKAGDELPVKISVNMSAVQLLRDDVTKAVSNAIDGAGICGNRLTIELTESAFVADPDGAKKILESLKDLDTYIAMDDFGTGYSNLSYLQQLPIDVLKIDRSFISGMMVDKDKRAIVRTVLSLARALGMKTTAEGIETEEISDVLKRLGCTVGQGYYYARPLESDAAFAFLMSDIATNTI